MNIFSFFIYFFTSVVLLYFFMRVYVASTPHENLSLIASGNIPIAIVLAGAMFGFTIPLVTLSFVGIDWVDFVIYSIFAGIIQLGLFWLLYKFFPIDFEKYGADNASQKQERIVLSKAILYMSSSLCVGIINAFSHIPFGFLEVYNEKIFSYLFCDVFCYFAFCLRI